jgi:hypothetical protein
MLRRCSARRLKPDQRGLADERCHYPAVRGQRVCRFHGGLSTGWRGQRSARHLESMYRGRAQWLERRMARKALGLPVERIGRLPGRRPGEPIEVSRARAAVMDKKKLLPLVLKPLAEMNHAEKLDHATSLALDETLYVLNLPREPDALKVMGLDAQKTQRMKMEVAQSVIATRAKVDDATLRHEVESDRLALMRERMRNLPTPEKDG